MKKNILTIALFVGFASSANAQCRQSQVCDDYGQRCRVIQVCRNSLDLPGVNLPPLPPLPTLELKPLPSLDLPPLGTTQCEYMQVNGRWQNVCR